MAENLDIEVTQPPHYSVTLKGEELPAGDRDNRG